MNRTRLMSITEQTFTNMSASSAWKRETAKEKSDPRPTAVQMAAPSYSPPPESRKRGANADRKRKLAGLMGVGALLTNARERFGNEEGELQEEDGW